LSPLYPISGTGYLKTEQLTLVGQVYGEFIWQQQQKTTVKIVTILSIVRLFCQALSPGT